MNLWICQLWAGCFNHSSMEYNKQTNNSMRHEILKKSFKVIATFLAKISTKWLARHEIEWKEQWNSEDGFKILGKEKNSTSKGLWDHHDITIAELYFYGAKVSNSLGTRRTWPRMHINFIKYDPKSTSINKKFKKFKYLKEAFNKKVMNLYRF